MAHRRLSYVLAPLLAVTAPSALYAQGTDLGTIRGNVTDVTGAQVPNAQVRITDLATQITRIVSSGAHGHYEAPALTAGKYRVSVSAAGFGTSVVNNVEVKGSDQVDADVTLNAAETTTVAVTTEASIINTDDSTLSETLSPTAVIELPRDSRDIYSFLYLNPNITQSGTSGDFKFLGGQSYGASFSVDGQRSNGGVFGQATQTEPSLESVGELNVLSNGFSAEYAGIANIRVDTKRGGSSFHGSLFYNNKNSALAAWTLADKNNLANFSPTPFLSRYPNPYFNITDIGGSVGGPIPGVKKTFFFTAFEHDWTVQPSETGRSNSIPHPDLIAGNFSIVANPCSRPLVPSSVVLTASEQADTITPDCSNSGVPGPARFNIIPSRLLNADVQKMFKTYYPQVGTGAAYDSIGRVVGFQTNVPGHSNRNMGDLRIDHDFSDNDRIWGVYHAGSEMDQLSEVASPLTGLGLLHTDRLNNSVSTSYTHMFGPHVVNEARGGFNRQYLYTHSNTTLRQYLQSIGLTDGDITAYNTALGPNILDTHGEMAVSITNFQGVPNGGRNTDRPLSQNLITFGDTVTLLFGRHNIRVGADFVRNAAVDGFTSGRGQPRGLITYSQSGTTGLADLLLGMAPDRASYTPKGRPAMDVYNWESGSYIQDDVRVNQRLTVNLGLRYDLFTPYTEKNDLMVNFDPDLKNPISGTNGVFLIPSKKTLQYIDPSIINFGYVTAADSGLGIGRSLLKTDGTDINPRFGIAYRLRTNSVLRGGYGLFTPTSSAHVIRDPLATNSFNQTYTKRSVKGGAQLDPWPGFNGASGVAPLAGGVASGFGNTPSANNVPVDLKNPRLQQWNATFEQELPSQWALRVSYIGAYMGGEITGRDINMISPNNIMFGNTTGDGVTICDPTQGDCAYSAKDKARMRFPALGDYLVRFGNNGHGLTASGQGEIKRQMRHLTFSLVYTYLQQKSTGVDTDNDSLGGDAYDQTSPNSDYGTESFISKHRVVSYAVLDLPYGRGQRFGSNISRWQDAILGGWQTTYNMFAKSGTGFTPFWICTDCDPVLPGNIVSGAVDAVGDFGGPSFRPKVIGDPNHGSPKNTQWNINAFTFPDLGSTLFSDPANARRNSLMGPGTWGVNLGIHKNFTVTQRVGFELGADADNVFNHPLVSPDSNSSDDFSNLGTFNVHLDPKTGNFQPLNTEYYRNPDFGLKYQSITQEGIDNRRSIRLRGRITF